MRADLRPFVYAALPSRVVFGAGGLDRLPAELAHLGAARALVLTTPDQAALGHRVASLLGAQAAGVFAAAEMHVPVKVAAAAARSASARPWR